MTEFTEFKVEVRAVLYENGHRLESRNVNLRVVSYQKN